MESAGRELDGTRGRALPAGTPSAGLPHGALAHTGGRLASTGADTDGILAAMVAMIAAGLAALGLRRRKRGEDGERTEI